VVIGAKFFSMYDESTRNVFALLAFAAGFLVRPFDALVFRRLTTRCDAAHQRHRAVITPLSCPLRNQNAHPIVVVVCKSADTKEGP